MPLRRPLLRRLRLPFRHECSVLRWCWLEDSNPPPLAYKASALPDELSQPGKLTNGCGAAPDAEASVLERAGVRRRVQFWTFTMSKSAAPPAPLSYACEAMARSTRERAHAQGTWMVFGCSAGSPAGHLPLLPVRRREGALRRLFRFRYRALSGPTARFGGTQIRHANAREPPIARSIGPCGGGAERGGDM